jgi:hypothetical protein
VVYYTSTRGNRTVEGSARVLVKLFLVECPQIHLHVLEPNPERPSEPHVELADANLVLGCR